MIDGINLTDVKNISYEANVEKNTFSYVITLKSNEVITKEIDLYVDKKVNEAAKTVANLVQSIKNKQLENTPEKEEKKVVIDSIFTKNSAYSYVVDMLKQGAAKDDVIKELTEKYKGLLSNVAMVNIYLRAERKVTKENTPEKEEKVNKEVFKKKVAQLTDDEIEMANAYFENPSAENKTKFVAILNKYTLTVEELKNAVIVRNKTKEKVVEKPNRILKHKIVRSTKEKIELFDHIFINYVNKGIEPAAMQDEFERLSKDYNVSVDDVKLLYEKAVIKKKRDDIFNEIKEELTTDHIVRNKNSQDYTKLLVAGDKEAYTVDGLITSGNKYIIPAFRADWADLVREKIHEPVQLYEAVNVMQLAERGASLKEIRKHIDNIHNSDINAANVVKIVRTFSPYGKQVEAGCRKYMMTKPERLKAFVLDKKEHFSKKPNITYLDKNSAIAKLKSLKEEMSKIDTTVIENEKGRTM